ncbi:hypothetical protein KFU94_01145 [Chloroflexi bacterium TSY]|nr:hypothetical protein [Chloroflexi bacterium TSY]
MESRKEGKFTAGVILTAVGIGFLALQFLEGFGEAIIFFLIGGAFIASYLYTRVYGLLIPGGLLMGLGLGMVGESTILGFDDFSGFGLGLGFVSIYVIALVYQRKTHWWPLIPGLFFIVATIGSMNASIERLLAMGWPLILVAIGLIFVASAIGFTEGKKGADVS